MYVKVKKCQYVINVKKMTMGQVYSHSIEMEKWIIYALSVCVEGGEMYKRFAQHVSNKCYQLYKAI